MLKSTLREFHVDGGEPSLGPREPAGRGSEFAQYDQYDLGIKFLLAMLRASNEPAEATALCVPSWRLCVYGDAPRGIPYSSAPADARADTCPSSRRDGKTHLPLFLDVRAGLYASHLSTGTPSLVVPPDAARVLEEDCGMRPEAAAAVASAVPRVAIANFGLYEDGDLQYGHANGLVFNARTRTIERYEPQGGDEADAEARDATIERLLRDAFPTWQYASVLSILGGDGGAASGAASGAARRGPQSTADAFEGMCETYATLFVLVRLRHLSATPAQVYAALAEAPVDELLTAALALNRKMARTLRRTPRGALRKVVPTRRSPAPWRTAHATKLLTRMLPSLRDAVRVRESGVPLSAPAPAPTPAPTPAPASAPAPAGSEMLASTRDLIDRTPTHAIRRALRSFARDTGSSLRRAVDFEVRSAPTRRLARYTRDALRRVVVM